jgi:DNA polymerase I
MTGIIKFVTPTNVSEVLHNLSKAEAIGFDTETVGLHPKDGKLRLIQLSVPGTNYILDCFKHDPHMLAPVFDGSKILIGHNLAFELRWLWSLGIELPNGRNLFDTMIAGQLLDAGLMPAPSHSLQGMAAQYLGVDLAKEQQRSDWSGQLSKEQLIYAAQDSAILLPLREKLLFRLHEAQLERVMSLEMRCLPGMAWLTMCGMYVDKESWMALADQNAKDVDALQYSLAEMTDTQDLFGWSQINWRSPMQVLAVFRARGHNISDTNDETISRLAASGDELAITFKTFREKDKRRGTYGENWWREHVHANSRVYGDYRQVEARTGRMSCADPNMQNIPRDKLYRGCFKAPPGKKLTIGDYSQIELRIAVEKTRDPAGIQAYCVDRLDLHKATARLILGNENDEARQVAKSLNFALIFGAGAPRLQEYAKQKFNVDLTLEQATDLRNKWRDTYKGIIAWHKSIRDGVEATRTLSGRRRLNVDSYTMKLNTPVQGTGVDGIKAAVALAYERRKLAPPSTKLVGVIHDEIVMECDAEDAEEVRDWQEKCMVDGMKSFLKTVPVVAEVKIADSWGEK